MLYTNLKHIESAMDYTKIVNGNKNVVMICGNMAPVSVKNYLIAESMVKDYKHVKFFDLEFDNPEFYEVRNLAQAKKTEIPFVFFYKNGELSRIINGSLTKVKMKEILDGLFGARQTQPKGGSIHTVRS